jgi:hypothetical protein
MKASILFPCEYNNLKQVDSNFKDEYEVSKTLGIESFFYDHDLFVNEGKLKFFGTKEEFSMVIMRSWMMNPMQYQELFETLQKMDYHLYTNLNSYIRCHYLKKSYNYIKKYTAKTLFSDKFDKETLGKMFDKLGCDIILKDYVKSEKGIPGIFMIPKETTHEQLENVVKHFIEARGKLFNEGVSFREFVKLKKYDGEVNEWRVFVFNGEIVAVEQNSNININTYSLPKPSDNFIKKVTSKISLVSLFYTIDFAERSNGEWMVVETGDGQVSGLAPNQNPIGLYNAFLTIN